MPLPQHHPHNGAGVDAVALKDLRGLPNVLWVSDNHPHSPGLRPISNLHPILTRAWNCTKENDCYGETRGDEREACHKDMPVHRVLGMTSISVGVGVTGLFTRKYMGVKVKGCDILKGVGEWVCSSGGVAS